MKPVVTHSLKIKAGVKRKDHNRIAPKNNTKSMLFSLAKSF